MSSYSNKINPAEFDRIDEDPDNWGGPYYGKDDGEGVTDWYDIDGNLSASSETPADEEEYQHKFEDWEKFEYDAQYRRETQQG